ncbi:hypothetical protein TNCV_3532041 [Trichonephila clavipes]|nr:hypothetical protein TNCV_3532041 [Trichonephila clavipes]
MRLSNISKKILKLSPGYRLLRRQSSQRGPRWSQRKQDSSYGPSRRSLVERSGERAGEFYRTTPSNNRPGYAVPNALRTCALKCARTTYDVFPGTLCSRTFYPYMELAPYS